MSTATLEFSPSVPKESSRRRGQLALTLQEAFTVAVRLRANRQVAADADSFRTHVKTLLATADERALRAGYPREYVKLAIYAFVAFLDESVLNSTQPIFAEWPGRPLQEEVFGDHVAGETFFRHLEDLLGRQDSEDLADLLEVYQLCLRLGFRGRFGAGPGGELHGLMSSVQDKIRRIRGATPEVSPAWRPPEELIESGRDPWLPSLVVLAGVTLVTALALFIVFRLVLGGGVAELQGLTLP